jgi:hypothetical protein
VTAAPAGAAWQEPEQPDPILAALLDGRGYTEPEPSPDWCVNASLFDYLRGEDPELAAWGHQQLARAMRSRDAAGVGARPAYSLPRVWGCPGHPSLDTREQVPRQVTRSRGQRIPPERRRRQRDRYKRAMGLALDHFGRQHLHRDPRAGEWRPRWLDHKAGCSAGWRCDGCARIPVPARSRWHRRGARHDYLQVRTIPVASWLLDKAQAIRGCRQAIAVRDEVCGGVMVVPQSCDVRTCPDCEAARQTKVVAHYQAAVEQLAPDLTRFLTLTILNRRRGELAAGLDHLGRSIDKLKNRALWRGGRCRDRARCRQPADPDRPGWRLPHQPVTASMTSIEVTYNAEAKTWHPHAHLILEGPSIDQAELADAWQAITADSRVVWIESVRRYAEQRAGGDVRGALRELLKYAAKPTPAFLSEQDPAPVAELLVALRGRHLTTTGGRLYGLDTTDLDERDPGDLVLVYSEDPHAEPFRAPAVCPLHGGAPDWRLAGHVPRVDCEPQPARAGPYPQVLVWRPPLAAVGQAGPEQHQAGAGDQDGDADGHGGVA